MAFNHNCILLCQKDFVLTPCVDAREQTTTTNKTIYSFQFITPLKISYNVHAIYFPTLGMFTTVLLLEGLQQKQSCDCSDGRLLQNTITCLIQNHHTGLHIVCWY